MMILNKVLENIQQLQYELQIKKHIEEVVKNIQSKLPKREHPRKPLIYDVQWQDINTVKDCGQRVLNEWSLNNITGGYPKLWRGILERNYMNLLLI